MTANPTIDPVPFGHWTLRDEAAQRRSSPLLGGRMHPRRLTPRHAALGWLCILILAIANGALRESFLIPHFGSLSGTVASGVLLSAAALLVAIALLRWRPASSLHQAAQVGVGWLAATLAFEFAFGLLIQGKSVSDLFAAYTFEDGNLWPVVLLVVASSPYLSARYFRGLALENDTAA